MQVNPGFVESESSSAPVQLRGPLLGPLFYEHSAMNSSLRSLPGSGNAAQIQTVLGRAVARAEIDKLQRQLAIPDNCHWQALCRGLYSPPAAAWAAMNPAYIRWQFQ